MSEHVLAQTRGLPPLEASTGRGCPSPSLLRPQSKKAQLGPPLALVRWRHAEVTCGMHLLYFNRWSCPCVYCCPKTQVDVQFCVPTQEPPTTPKSPRTDLPPLGSQRLRGPALRGTSNDSTPLPKRAPCIYACVNTRACNIARTSTRNLNMEDDMITWRMRKKNMWKALLLCSRKHHMSVEPGAHSLADQPGQREPLLQHT